jgi:hypothetical protein
MILRPPRADDRQRGDRGGFRPQYQWSERDRRPARGDRCLAFLAGPAAFGTHQYRHRIGRVAYRRQCAAERGRPWFFVQHIPMRGGQRERFIQVHRFRHFRKKRPPRLLARFERDSPPALDSFVRGAFQAVLATGRLQRHNFRDAQLRGFLDHPLEMVELYKRRGQNQHGSDSMSRQLFEGPKHYVFFARRFDFSQINTLVVGYLITLARLDPEDAREVPRVLAVDFRVPVPDLVYKKSAAHAGPPPVSALLYPVFFMIAHLRGTLLEKHPNVIIVDVSGVGYEVTIPVSVFSSLPEKGQQVQLHIHTHVREDALTLFGFLSPGDKAMF